MNDPSTEAVGTAAEQAVRALYSALNLYFLRHFRLWSHDNFGSDFRRGEAYALTGLALIPELRAALDALDEHLGPELAAWHESFKPAEEG